MNRIKSSNQNNSSQNMNHKTRSDHGYEFEDRNYVNRHIEKINKMNQTQENKSNIQSQLPNSSKSMISFSKSFANNSEPSYFMNDATWEQYLRKCRSSCKSKNSSEVVKSIPPSECDNEDFEMSAGYGTGIYKYKDEEIINLDYDEINDNKVMNDDAVELIDFVSSGEDEDFIGDMLMEIQKQSSNSKFVEEEIEIKLAAGARIYDSNIEINDLETQIQLDYKIKKKVSFSGIVEVIDCGELDEEIKKENDGNIVKEMLIQIQKDDVKNQIKEDLNIKKRVVFNDVVEVVNFVELDELVEGKEDGDMFEDSFRRIREEHNIKKKREKDKYSNSLFSINSNTHKFIKKSNTSVFKENSKSMLSKLVIRVKHKFYQFFIKELFSISPEVSKEVEKWSRKVRLKLV